MKRHQTPVRRMICLILCVLCLLPAVLPAAAQEPAKLTGKQVLTAIVRQSPSYSGYNIGRMEDGVALTVLGERGDFYRIDCYDMTGYIAKSQVLHTEDDKYYVNCKADSSETVVMTYATPSEALLLRHAIVALTQQQLGDPYVYGGTRPGGFDCSGLMQYVYGKNGFSIQRGSSGQLRDGIIVAKSGLQMGDLVFFRVAGETTPTSHVGIYVGDGRIIHSGNKGVAYADLDGGWYSDYYLCARRVINTDPTGSMTLPAVGNARSLITRTISGRTVS